jgi:uncharacterized BrkB/YihY/UPF0761 family membrane protein
MSADAVNDDLLETYKSLVTLSTEGFKFSALINGGAAVALLAYLGNVAGKDAARPDMSCAMFAFLFGLALVGFAWLFAYLTQLKRLNDIVDSQNPRGSWRLNVAITLSVLSLVAFIAGAVLAVVALK